MDQNNKASNSNVIQFPGRKKDAEVSPASARAFEMPLAKAAVAPVPKATTNSKKNIGATVLAIMLFTGAVNRYVYSSNPQATDLASQGRAIASVKGSIDQGRMNFTRDAQWEKDLANRLAAPGKRAVASAGISRVVTKEDRLRWGTLEEKYTITYDESAHKISGIFLQDPETNPSYVLDRSRFLEEYGNLLNNAYESSKLKSVETSNDTTVELYTIFDKDQRATGEARFELDRHKRLLSLKVEAINI